MKLTLDIPDGVVDRVVEAIAKKYRYDELEATQPNPISKQQFFRRTIIRLIKQAVKENEADIAREIATQEAVEKVEQEIDIT